MKEFLKSFFSFGFATSIQKMMGFLLLPIYTRIFTTTEFGVIDLIQVILGITSIFAVLQLETSLQRYYYDLKVDLKKTFISTIVIVITFFSFIVMIICLLLSGPLSDLIFNSVRYQPLIQLACVQLPFINFSMLAFVLLRYEKRNKIFVFQMLIKVTLMLGAILTLVVWLDQGIEGILYAQLLSLFVSSILLFFCVKDLLAFRFSFSQFKTALRYALPQIPARIGSVSLSYSNRFFMVSILSMASIGIFSTSLKLASVIQFIYTAFIMTWAPFMFEEIKKIGHQKKFAKILSFVSCIIFFLVSVLSLFSKELVYMVASEKFLEAHKYLGGLSLYFSLFIIKEIVDIGPKVKEKTKYLTYNFFVSVIINLLSLYFLMNYFGLYGVVISFIITNSVLVAVSWYISNRLYFVPFNLTKFLIVSLPALVLALLSMYIILTIEYKFLMAVLLIFFYGIFGYKEFFGLKKVSGQT